MKKYVGIFVATLAVLFCSAGGWFNAHVDKVDLPFVNDSDVLGKWVTVDYVKVPETFKPETRQNNPIYLKDLTFLADGKTSATNLTWTKGTVLDVAGEYANSYEIKEISGAKYLFLQWKTGDYKHLGMKPRYLVMKKE